MKINRRTILFLILFLVLGLVALWFFLFLNKAEQKEITEQTRNLFPFGQVDTGGANSSSGTQGTVGDDSGDQTQDSGEVIDEPKVKAGPRLRQISDFPTGGFAPIIREEEKEVTDISIDSLGVSSQTVQTIQVENPYVRYSSIKDASIFEAKLTPSSITRELIVKNFVPNAEQALFNSDGTRAIFRYWNVEERLPETYLAHIKPITMEIDECPYDLKKPVSVGNDSKHVLELHEFLNRNPRTQISRTGINAPGNESSVAVPATITAIKNFQSLYGLEIDGQIGGATSKKMLDICDGYMLEAAKKRFAALETRHEISGFFLPQNIISLGINPFGSDFFYLLKNKNGVTGVVRDFIQDAKKTIFESPYSEWLVIWNGRDDIELTTRSSYQALGYSYTLKASDGDYHKSFPQKTGLTTLANPNNLKVLITESLDDSLRTSIVDRASGRISPLGIQTFTEKCTWSRNGLKLYCAVPGALSYGGEYPDTWYQGLESYSDSLWVIDPLTNKTDLLSDIPTEFGEDLDVLKIGIDKNEEYLYFVDKNTEFLWSYRLQDV